jgi:hypothetical protein
LAVKTPPFLGLSMSWLASRPSTRSFRSSEPCRPTSRPPKALSAIAINPYSRTTKAAGPMPAAFAIGAVLVYGARNGTFVNNCYYVGRIHCCLKVRFMIAVVSVAVVMIVLAAVLVFTSCRKQLYD